MQKSVIITMPSSRPSFTTKIELWWLLQLELQKLDLSQAFVFEEIHRWLRPSRIILSPRKKQKTLPFIFTSRLTRRYPRYHLPRIYHAEPAPPVN